MRTITIASRKGGVGKSTIAAHLGVQATLTGKKVALIDCDSQGSLAAWWNERQADEPIFVKTDLSSLGECIQELKGAKIDYLFIDTPPAISQLIRNVASVSDLIIVPVKPSPHDLRAVAGTIDLIEPFEKPMVFVINSAIKRARLTSEAAIALSQHGTVSPAVLHHRVDFSSSMIDGRTVQELNAKSSSAQEVEKLWDYVLTRLRKCDNNEIRIKSEA